MSEFISGVLSGLVGAAVGGAFTALAARAQVRAVMQVAHIQIEADRRHSAESAYREQQLAAATALSKRLLQMLHEVRGMSEDHYFERHHQKEDDLPALPPSLVELQQINDWRRQLDFIQAEFGPLLSEDENEELESLFGYVTFGNNWQSIAKNYPNLNCPQCRWSDDFGDALSLWLKKVQGKMNELSLPLGRRPV
ncbi:hypothetical protein F8271_15740 [Micromonospora sp. ALFpr18c]|uniref:hypothetical protein n=1 Tax=Micromonospora sp. ALFpr18c TaxID=1458665 RepID=UPI00124B106B|nr:hypothetical protein [Micromonospora sp. ALFpr18c]KAB1940590.1 hypothetical protein F8271_15740 [Micromonospora sp. ALFpr18c]